MIVLVWSCFLVLIGVLVLMMMGDLVGVVLVVVASGLILSFGDRW